MATEINGNFSINLEINGLKSLLCNASALESSVVSMTGNSVEVTVVDSIQKCEVTIQRQLNLRDLLANQPLPLSVLRISETREWKTTDDESLTGSTKLLAPEIQLEITAELMILPNESQTTISFSANAQCRLPFFGSKIEQASAEYFQFLIEKELAALATYSA